MGGRRWVMLVVLAAVVVVNVVQFRSIEAAHGGVGYAALGRLPSSDILTLARANQRIDGTYGIYADLRRASPRSHLTVAPNGVLPVSGVRDLALGIGDAASVTVGDFVDTDAPPVAELLAQGGVAAASGTVAVDGREAPWQLIASDCGVALGATPGRDLVVVQWGTGSTLEVGLVESCLLPTGFAGPHR